MDSRIISKDRETFDVTISLFFKHKSGKNFRAKNEEKKKERGSPCLNSFLGEMKPKGLPFKRIEKVREVMQARIQDIQVGLKPIFSMIAMRKDHSILSKAFSMSKLRKRNPHFPFLFLKEWSS
jgi:hypothetical protein